MVLVVTFGGVPRVLMDGVITHRELTPGAAPGSPAHRNRRGRQRDDGPGGEVGRAPGQDEASIANRIIPRYASMGLDPASDAAAVGRPTVAGRAGAVQQGTDLATSRTMAPASAIVFYVVPRAAPMVNTAYWGPPVRIGVPQRALSVDLGAETNVRQLTLPLRRRWRRPRSPAKSRTG